jgi:hypothetical protein
VEHLSYFADSHGTRWVSKFTQAHPWEISATCLILSSTVEEAIVELQEFFVALEEISHTIIDLRRKEVLMRIGLGFNEVVSRCLFSNLI